MGYFSENASATKFLWLWRCHKIAENAQTANIISKVKRKFTDVYIMFTFQYRDLNFPFWDYNGNRVQSYNIPQVLGKI